MSSMKDPSKVANYPEDSATEPEESAPVTERFPAEVPQLALLCDGRVLVSTTELKAVNLAGRERWEGLILTEAEASDVLERLNFAEAAAPTVGRLLALDKKAKKTRNDGNGNDDENNAA